MNSFIEEFYYVSYEPTDNLKELFPEEYGMEDDIFEDEKTEQA